MIFKENRTGLNRKTKLQMTVNEARDDLWSIERNYIYRRHVEPRDKLHVPKEESFPLPLRKIDVVKRTNTTLDVLQESRIDDYWNIDGDRNISEPGIGFTQCTILNEKPPDGKTWSGRRLTKKSSNIKAR